MVDKTSALDTDIGVGIAAGIEHQEVAQQREGAAVRALGMGRYVNGGDNEATIEVVADSENGVLNVILRTNNSLEFTAVFHVAAAANRWHFVGAHRIGVQDRFSDNGIGIEALESVDINVVHHGVEWVSEVHRVESNEVVFIKRADCQTKRKASGRTVTVNLGTVRGQVSLNGLTRGHEFLENNDSVRFSDFFVVPATAKLGVLCSQLVLPWQDDLVVVGEPSALKVGVKSLTSYWV